MTAESKQTPLEAVIAESQKHALLRRVDTLFNPSTDDLVAAVLTAAELGFSPMDIVNAVRTGEALDVLHAATEPTAEQDGEYREAVYDEIDRFWAKRYSYDDQPEDW